MLGNIRYTYGSETTDKIICYFMRVLLRLQESGIERLPLEEGANTLDEPYRSFLNFSMEVLLDAQPPEIAQLLLDAEYDAVCGQKSYTAKELLPLRLIRELAWHIRYDKTPCEYLLRTGNLWGAAAEEYAWLTFYPNLPYAVRVRCGLCEPVPIPQEKFRLDDY